jgi:hypothetical protein
MMGTEAKHTLKLGTSDMAGRVYSRVVKKLLLGLLSSLALSTQTTEGVKKTFIR